MSTSTNNESSGNFLDKASRLFDAAIDGLDDIIKALSGAAVNRIHQWATVQENHAQTETLAKIFAIGSPAALPTEGNVAQYAKNAASWIAENRNTFSQFHNDMTLLSLTRERGTGADREAHISMLETDSTAGWTSTAFGVAINTNPAAEISMARARLANISANARRLGLSALGVSASRTARSAALGLKETEEDALEHTQSVATQATLASWEISASRKVLGTSSTPSSLAAGASAFAPLLGTSTSVIPETMEHDIDFDLSNLLTVAVPTDMGAALASGTASHGEKSVNVAVTGWTPQPKSADTVPVPVNVTTYNIHPYVLTTKGDSAKTPVVASNAAAVFPAPGLVDWYQHIKVSAKLTSAKGTHVPGTSNTIMVLVRDGTNFWSQSFPIRFGANLKPGIGLDTLIGETTLKLKLQPGAVYGIGFRMEQGNATAASFNGTLSFRSMGLSQQVKVDSLPTAADCTYERKVVTGTMAANTLRQSFELESVRSGATFLEHLATVSRTDDDWNIHGGLIAQWRESLAGAHVDDMLRAAADAYPVLDKVIHNMAGGTDLANPPGGVVTMNTLLPVGDWLYDDGPLSSLAISKRGQFLSFIRDISRTIASYGRFAPSYLRANKHSADAMSGDST